MAKELIQNIDKLPSVNILHFTRDINDIQDKGLELKIGQDVVVEKIENSGELIEPKSYKEDNENSNIRLPEHLDMKDLDKIGKSASLTYENETTSSKTSEINCNITSPKYSELNEQEEPVMLSSSSADSVTVIGSQIDNNPNSNSQNEDTLHIFNTNTIPEVNIPSTVIDIMDDTELATDVDHFLYESNTDSCTSVALTNNVFEKDDLDKDSHPTISSQIETTVESRNTCASAGVSKLKPIEQELNYEAEIDSKITFNNDETDIPLERNNKSIILCSLKSNNETKGYSNLNESISGLASCSLGHSFSQEYNSNTEDSQIDPISYLHHEKDLFIENYVHLDNDLNSGNSSLYKDSDDMLNDLVMGKEQIETFDASPNESQDNLDTYISNNVVHITSVGSLSPLAEVVEEPNAVALCDNDTETEIIPPLCDEDYDKPINYHSSFNEDENCCSILNYFEKSESSTDNSSTRSYDSEYVHSGTHSIIDDQIELPVDDVFHVSEKCALLEEPENDVEQSFDKVSVEEATPALKDDFDCDMTDDLERDNCKNVLDITSCEQYTPISNNDQSNEVELGGAALRNMECLGCELATDAKENAADSITFHEKIDGSRSCYETNTCKMDIDDAEMHIENKSCESHLSEVKIEDDLDEQTKDDEILPTTMDLDKDVSHDVKCVKSPLSFGNNMDNDNSDDLSTSYMQGSFELDMISTWSESCGRNSDESSFLQQSMDDGESCSIKTTSSLKRASSFDDTPVKKIKLADQEQEIKQRSCPPSLINTLSEASYTFDWDEYIQDKNADTTPPTLFQHVEKSLETGIQQGQYLEVFQEKKCTEMKDDISGSKTYWPAKVLSVCGTLLRLKYAVIEPSIEFWSDLSTSNLHELGYGDSSGSLLSPPLGDNLDINKLKMDLTEELKNAESAPTQALKKEEREIFTRIEEGDLLEILDDRYPNEGWLVTVKRNCGGRLLVQYYTPGFDTDYNFWIFFMHPRVKPIHWINERGFPFRYKIPDCLVLSDEETSKLLNEVKTIEFSKRFRFLLSFESDIPTHNFHVGDCVEAVLPISMETIHVARVTEVINEHFVKLAIDDFSWVVSADNPLILPSGFCEKFSVTLSSSKNITLVDISGGSHQGEKEAAAVWNTAYYSAEDIGFAIGQKLEAVDPNTEDKLCVATILKIHGHLLWLSLDSDPNRLPFIRAASSTSIFPAGWSQEHKLPLFLPASYEPRPPESSNGEEDKNLLPNQESKHETLKCSVWCPELYINHCCYPGPFLSRTRVANQTQSVGPGPLELVLREILSCTINAGYIPTRVLRELQNSIPQNSSWHPTLMKAKFKRYVFKANVFIPSNALEVDLFLQAMAKVLQCCPNLWAQASSGDLCPHYCNTQYSSRPKGGTQFRLMRRKKGGKKRLFYPIRSSGPEEVSERPDELEAEAEEDDDDDEAEIEVDLERDSCLFTGFDEPESPPELIRRSKRNSSTLRDSKDIATAIDTATESESPGGPNLTGQMEKKVYQVASVLQPAKVASDPLYWSVSEVEKYVLSQPSISHLAYKIKEQEIDGRALLLLNLPSLIHYLHLPHALAVILARFICKVKLAHFMYFHRPVNA